MSALLRFAGMLGSFALSYRYWQPPTANNGRPYWDLSYTYSGSLPSIALSPSSSDWGFMCDLGSIKTWNTCTITFDESHTGTSFQVVVSDVSTGSVWRSSTLNPSGTVLSISRGSFGIGGYAGTGISSLPTSIRYVGIGLGSGGLSFKVNTVTIA